MKEHQKMNLNSLDSFGFIEREHSCYKDEQFAKVQIEQFHCLKLKSLKIIVFQLMDKNKELNSQVEELQKLNLDLQRNCSKKENQNEMKEVGLDRMAMKHLKRSIKPQICEFDDVSID